MFEQDDLNHHYNQHLAGQATDLQQMNLGFMFGSNASSSNSKSQSSPNDFVNHVGQVQFYKDTSQKSKKADGIQSPRKG